MYYNELPHRAHERDPGPRSVIELANKKDQGALQDTNLHLLVLVNSSWA